MAVNYLTENPAMAAYDARTKRMEDSRAARLRQQSDQLAFDQAQRQDTAQQAIDQAIRDSAMGAPNPQAGAAPMGQGVQPVIQQQDLSPGAPVTTTPIPAAVASSGLTASPQTIAGRSPSQVAASAAPAPGQAMQLSPFDTPEFTANLQARLAQIPGAGAQLMQMRKERDNQITQVLEMAANGNVDTARFLARQNGLNIPDQMFTNGDVARGMTLAAKAYPDEPNKAQVFFQAYMQAPGGLDEKVNAGMNAGGRPTTASQRQLANSIALLKYKAANPQLTTTNPYKRYQNVAGVGLVDLAAEGGPAVALGPRFDYQRALQENIKSVSNASMGTKTADQIYADAKMLTDRMAEAATQSAPVQSGLTATPQAPMPVVQAPVASPQLNNAPVQGSIVVKNPRTGETLQIQPSDLGAAQAEGFEVVQ